MDKIKALKEVYPHAIYGYSPSDERWWLSIPYAITLEGKGLSPLIDTALSLNLESENFADLVIATNQST